MDGAGQLHYVQQVEEGMSGWEAEEKASDHYPGAEPFEIASIWTSTLRDLLS